MGTCQSGLVTNPINSEWESTVLPKSKPEWLKSPKSYGPLALRTRRIKLPTFSKTASLNAHDSRERQERTHPGLNATPSRLNENLFPRCNYLTPGTFPPTERNGGRGGLLSVSFPPLLLNRFGLDSLVPHWAGVIPGAVIWGLWLGREKKKKKKEKTNQKHVHGQIPTGAH